MNYEQKYNDALERVRDLMTNQNPPAFDKHLIETVFPELKENEDEKNIKDLIDELKCSLRAANCQNEVCNGGHEKRIALLEWSINWLEKQKPNTRKREIDDAYLQGICDAKHEIEKQGEQKPKHRYTFNSIPRLLDMIEPTDRAKSYCQKLIDSLLKEGYAADAKIVSDCLKQMNGEKVAMATMDKHADKVEPKFKVGNWVLSNNVNIYQVVKIREDNRYELHGQRGEIMSVPTNFTYGLRLWTIQYAKDGDVLLEEETGEPFIYNGNRAIYFSGYFLGSYCGIYKGEFNQYGNIRYWGKNSCPATKEQRDLLFTKMKEAGYEWDADKKELKKI